ncbi:response regulator transcription factor [Paenibacillus roseipurpureus]|uniref:Response regulator transcription factor n=1 Tax=Paenibacillus roseopurpureus TaxID=2918901 RepID=A0AA96RKI8_9BACL|nr:response regulator transcription factor [Paenibacillus sp. MBLB1832]WNR44361.1 response regulator transcription factor [Paenibacillus sp. MBLB1832]
MTYKLMIVDDQRLLVDGLMTIINFQDDMEVVGTAENGVKALELIQNVRPDVVLMDVQMPVMNGVETTKRMMSLYPDTIILILSTFADADIIVECMAHGAKGFLLKDIRGERLVAMIRDAISGELVLPAAIATKLAERLHRLSSNLKDELDKERMKNRDFGFTEREEEIIRLLVKGWNNRQIAAALFISEGTTRNYISAIYNKLGTSDRAHALVLLKELMDEK